MRKQIINDFDEFCKNHPRIAYVTMGEMWGAAHDKYAASWRPIDTAPKDGTRFIGGHYQTRITQPNCFLWYVAIWAKEGWIPTDDDGFGIQGNDGEFYCPCGFYREELDRGDEVYRPAKPTHWLPIPQPQDDPTRDSVG